MRLIQWCLRFWQSRSAAASRQEPSNCSCMMQVVLWSDFDLPVIPKTMIRCILSRMGLTHEWLRQAQFRPDVIIFCSLQIDDDLRWPLTTEVVVHVCLIAVTALCSVPPLTILFSSLTWVLKLGDCCFSNMSRFWQWCDSCASCVCSCYSDALWYQSRLRSRQWWSLWESLQKSLRRGLLVALPLLSVSLLTWSPGNFLHCRVATDSEDTWSSLRLFLC